MNLKSIHYHFSSRPVILHVRTMHVLLTAVFQQPCPGTHGGIENLMRLFWRGGHYSITVSAASGSYPTCAARWQGVGLARTTCEMSNLSKAFPAFLFLKVGQRTGFVKETRLLHSSVLQPRGRFIIFTCQFLKCKVIITKVKITLSEYFGRWKHRCWTQQTNVISASSDSFMNVKSTLVQCF